MHDFGESVTSFDNVKSNFETYDNENFIDGCTKF